MCLKIYEHLSFEERKCIESSVESLNYLDKKDAFD